MSIVKKHVDEIREMWQSRALRGSSGQIRAILIAAIAKEYPAALEILLKATFPGFVDIARPMIISYAYIDIGGRIIATMIEADDSKADVVVFENEGEFIMAMRRLADGLRLDDADRIAMFQVLQKWVKSDLRFNHLGKLAS